MKMFNTTEKRMNEIVFANRNKEYGAYAIRAGYDDTVTKSLGFVGALIATLLLVSFIYTKMNPAELASMKSDGQIIISCGLQPPEEQHRPEQRSAAPKSNAMMAPEIKDDVKEPEIKKDDTPVDDPKGDPNGKIGGTGTSTDSTAIVSNEPEVIKVKKAEPEKNPDQMPELFNLHSILSKNIHYPELAKEGGISGTVIVNFIIDEEGNVEKTSILRGIGFGCDEEALRVISLLPKWKPGIKDGKPVKVTFNLPIRFTLK